MGGATGRKTQGGELHHRRGNEWLTLQYVTRGESLRRKGPRISKRSGPQVEKKKSCSSGTRSCYQKKRSRFAYGELAPPDLKGGKHEG